ncbi:TerB family tellurite resistance protein, partial [Amylibacter sp.]|nr:TerB family tellurite resistance protein [Amylibacter sp.]
MLKDILNAFKAPETSTLRTEDARIAMAALLVRIARSDEDYDDDEKLLINKMLQSRYNLVKDETESIRKQAEDLEAQAPDTVRFTRLIKSSIPFEDRKSIVRD